MTFFSVSIIAFEQVNNSRGIENARLTHFIPLVYTHLKGQKISGFLISPGGIRRNYWFEMG